MCYDVMSEQQNLAFDHSNHTSPTNLMEWVACQEIFGGSGLDQMGGLVQTKWVVIYCWVPAKDGIGLDQMGGLVQTKWAAIYCWVPAKDGMGSLPENILGIRSGPNGWPGPDKMGSHILLCIGLG
ncbi:hypothetical protein BYT27DRAFT_7206141 [Phlegmacium glaucopus]|nr:hypothetical protein BYT27DRAFT_7206141 [Phlegmacium glaucopus]